MIISRTPYRISFFGGGTDYPAWYKEYGGRILATTIDKYCYISTRYLPPFFKHNSRILYSKIEEVNSVDEIRHPAVREILKYFHIHEGVEIHHDGDLPARSGIGSSSAFTVGLLHTLFALKEKMVAKIHLAKEAIRIEQHILKENVGCQDQVSAAFGGFNRVDFAPNDEISIVPIILSQERLNALQDHLLLYFTGISRTASEIAKEQIKKTKEKKRELTLMREMVDESISILTGTQDMGAFGRLLHEHWMIKRSLSKNISSNVIDQIYEKARNAGAIGGKILGAGGGGFMLLFAHPKDHAKIKEKLSNLLRVSFRFENMGSQIIFYHPNILIEAGNIFNRNAQERFKLRV
ncbi:MAG: kinase [Elusimicrobia bacterium]|nr:kinase [Elusimicrobiota bacterium]